MGNLFLVYHVLPHLLKPHVNTSSCQSSVSITSVLGCDGPFFVNHLFVIKFPSPINTLPEN